MTQHIYNLQLEAQTFWAWFFVPLTWLSHKSSQQWPLTHSFHFLLSPIRCSKQGIQLQKHWQGNLYITYQNKPKGHPYSDQDCWQPWSPRNSPKSLLSQAREETNSQTPVKPQNNHSYPTSSNLSDRKENYDTSISYSNNPKPLFKTYPP